MSTGNNCTLQYYYPTEELRKKYKINCSDKFFLDYDNFKMFNNEAFLKFVEEKYGDSVFQGDSPFTFKDDYINLSEAVRDFPNLYEVKIDSDKEYKQTLEILNNQLESIPLFVKTSSNDIFVLSEFELKKVPKKGITLIYVGQKI